jgi:OOP family OmpA-OmpF porin
MCPNSLADQRVLTNGCSSGQSTVLDGVNFKSNSDVLTLDGQRALYKVYVALRDSPAYVIEIQGHTDNLGSGANNLKLSQARANSVLKFLSEVGINPDRLFAKGYGDTRPVGDNRDPAGRALNRRVELKVELIGG